MMPGRLAARHGGRHRVNREDAKRSPESSREQTLARRRAETEAARDAALVEQVRRGKQEALSELYDRHATTVYSIALNVLKDPGRAEDVTHDVFLRLWTQPDRYDPSVGRFAPWFYRVARNRSIDVIRQRRRELRPEEPQVFELTLADSAPKPDEAAVANDDAERVRAALQTLPDNQRELLELAYFSGMTQSQMAEYLHIPLGTIKTRVRTGLRQLRAILESESE